jgi:hypothetical protein
MSDRALTIRMAAPEDAGTLRRLAQLDSARPLRGRVLLAESDGMPVAAVGLETGLVTADPFQHTAAAVRMLMLRRYQVMGQASDAAPAPLLLRRLVPKPSR